MSNQPYFKRKEMSLFNKFSMTLALACITMQLGSAQQQWRAYAGSTFYFAELNADGQSGVKSVSEPSAGINLGIAAGLNDNWSIHSGLGISYIQTGNTVGSYRDVENTTDQEGESFEFRYNLTNYEEKQQSVLLSIPVSVQYETSGNQTRFYSKLGASANFFVGSKSTGSANSLVTSGYFERFNGELTAPRFAGFGTFENIEFTDKDLEIKPSYNAFVELGVKEQITTGHWLYIGAFVEYGLNDLSDNQGSSLIQYNQNQPIDFINNSVLNASNQTTGEPFLGKINLMMIGLRINYDFGI
ncbi:MAG: hypothetical protein NWQ19_03965 [Nonlabens sp.]|nr:hypothetical protein [Nonlabens sp.]